MIMKKIRFFFYILLQYFRENFYFIWKFRIFIYTYITYSLLKTKITYKNLFSKVLILNTNTFIRREKPDADTLVYIYVHMFNEPRDELTCKQRDDTPFISLPL